MRQCGITAADFSLLTRLSSWAVCGWRDRDGSFGEPISPLFQQAWDCGGDCSLKSFLNYCNCKAEVAAVWGPLKSFLNYCNCKAEVAAVWGPLKSFLNYCNCKAEVAAVWGPLKSFLNYCNCKAEVAAVWGPLKSFLTCCKRRVHPCLKHQEPVNEASFFFFCFLLHILIVILCWFF